MGNGGEHEKIPPSPPFLKGGDEIGAVEGRKEDSPQEIVLKKSATGDWSVPHDNGSPPAPTPWQRFMRGVAALYLLLLAGAFLLLVPNQERIERTMVFAVTEEAKRYEGLAFAGESPRKIFDEANSRGFAPWIAHVRSTFKIGPEGDSGFAAIERDYNRSLSALPFQQVGSVVLTLLLFFAPAALFRLLKRTVRYSFDVRISGNFPR